MIDPIKLREFRSGRQWFEGRRIRDEYNTPAFHLDQQGWVRGVGASGPYFHFKTRGGLSREIVDQALANQEIHELPSARGCTYIVPSHSFANALALAKHPEDEPKLDSGERKLGITFEQIEKLKTIVIEALKTGEADPRELKTELGERVVNYGDAGKKYGITTDLPGVILRLQQEGKVRRIPTNGRLDQERYKYALWDVNPLDSFNLSKLELQGWLALEYFWWIGPATLEEFKWFSGFSKRDILAAFELKGISECVPGYFAQFSVADTLDSWLRSLDDPIFKMSAPNPQFLTSLDNLLHLTRNLDLHVNPEDRHRIAPLPGEKLPSGGLTDLYTHAIFDRGRLVGQWLYDPDNQELVYTAWASDKDLIAQRAAETQTFIQEQLGDARSFSLDSPKNRIPRINFLREQPNYHG